MRTVVTLAELLAGRPDGPEVDVAGLAERVRASGRVLLVLDDDPTGTQSVADLPVLMTWTATSMGWALEQGRPAVYVMTNTRSLPPAEAEQRNREVARTALAAARERGIELAFVSRSDSTLRGHFPLETDVLAEEVEAATGRPVDGVLVVPAFGDAGRITVDGVHYAGADGSYLPVGESEFARDATFGYASSDLRQWVQEKSGGRIAAEQVASIDSACCAPTGPAWPASSRGCTTPSRWSWTSSPRTTCGCWPRRCSMRRISAGASWFEPALRSRGPSSARRRTHR